MHILISNDDGIQARGIQALRSALERDHEVSVSAPERQQSAMGHAITMHKPLYATLQVWGPRSRGWRINGTPADCVKLAVGALLDKKPDLMLSGINDGSNLGRDVFYSGTVSAAMEAMFYGIPAIALSMENAGNDGIKWAAGFVRWWLSSPAFVMPPPGVIYNVNFPNGSGGIPERLVVVPLGTREYANDFQRALDPRGREYFWIAGERLDNLDESDTDVAQHHAGAITLTPVQMLVTNEALLANLSSFAVPQDLPL